MLRRDDQRGEKGEDKNNMREIFSPSEIDSFGPPPKRLGEIRQWRTMDTKRKRDKEKEQIIDQNREP